MGRFSIACRQKLMLVVVTANKSLRKKHKNIRSDDKEPCSVVVGGAL
jgi:hypothetical protein